MAADAATTGGIGAGAGTLFAVARCEHFDGAQERAKIDVR